MCPPHSGPCSEVENEMIEINRLVLAIILLASVAGCRRTDVREVTVSLPELNESSRQMVVQALSKCSGIQKDSYVWDMEKKTLTLRYDSMTTAQTNIRMTIAAKGVKVDFPPNNPSGKAGYIDGRTIR